MSNSSVVILMGTYNGSKYLEEQLNSIKMQSHQNWRLIISDDGSNDHTINIIQKKIKDWPSGKIELREGPRKGFCQNFLSMACDSNIKADFYAFADQDDVWLPRKLEIALENINQNSDECEPYLYCGRTAYVKNDLVTYAFSPNFSRPKTFHNALVQSIAGANTMVFNQPVKIMLEEVGVVPTVSHDWWLYQLVSGSGGGIFYDTEPQILYRQHEDALVGGNTSFLNKLSRVRRLFQGQFKIWNDQNVEALNRARHKLSVDASEALDLFIKLRQVPFPQGLKLMLSGGFYRQDRAGTIALAIAAALKKL